MLPPTCTHKLREKSHIFDMILHKFLIVSSRTIFQRDVMPQTSTPTIWGIPRYFVLAALIILILVVPVFPREKIVHVSSTTMVTLTQTSYSYITSFQTVSQQQQTEIQVYVGYITQGYEYQGNSYCYWDPFYGWVCGYYNYQTKQVTIDPTDHVIRYDQTNEGGGSYTLTLYTYEKQQMVYRGVTGWDLTRSATVTVTGMVTATNTIVNTQTIPYETVHQQDTSHDIVVTEYVSIIQILFHF
jgi:hypothetical protein